MFCNKNPVPKLKLWSCSFCYQMTYRPDQSPERLGPRISTCLQRHHSHALWVLPPTRSRQALCPTSRLIAAGVGADLGSKRGPNVSPASCGRHGVGECTRLGGQDKRPTQFTLVSLLQRHASCLLPQHVAIIQHWPPTSI